MFSQLFSDQPVLPKGWDVRHLWVAEVLVASVIQADDPEFRGKMDDPETFRLCIESGLAEMMNHADYRERSSLCPDDAFLNIVKSGLTDFLRNECSHIYEAFTRDPVLSVRPDGDTLSAVLKNDPLFRDFVVASGDRVRQSKCGCRKCAS
ncbi:MAG TPA: hypothetical protein PLA90_07455 [Candidatus Sumerlaeota bacterium]|nr:hypothetical protein [Candidatus Sumerlaeota bacterium]